MYLPILTASCFLPNRMWDEFDLGEDDDLVFGLPPERESFFELEDAA